MTTTSSRVTVRYVDRRTQQAQVAQFTQAGGRERLYFCCETTPASAPSLVDGADLNGIDFLEVVDEPA